MCPKRLCPGALSPSPCTRVRVVSIASLTGTSVWAISSDGTESSPCVAVAHRGLNGHQPPGVLVHTHQTPRTLVLERSLRPSLFRPATLARVVVLNGPSRSRSNERTVRNVQVLPVARVVCTLLHTLQDQRVSLAQVWNAF